MVVDHHALLHPAGGQTTRHEEGSGGTPTRPFFMPMGIVKVVQELLRHSSSLITMDVYAQAQTPAKRAAQQKVVEMVRVEEAKKTA